MAIAEKVKEFFHNEGIHSTTIQPEFIDLEVIIHLFFINLLINHIYLQYKVKPDDESDCVLECPRKEVGNCVPQTCCGPQQKADSPKLLSVTNGVFTKNNSTSNLNNQSGSASSSKNNSPHFKQKTLNNVQKTEGTECSGDHPHHHPLEVASNEFVEVITSSSGSSNVTCPEHDSNSIAKCPGNCRNSEAMV